MAISRISKKRLEREFGGKLPYSTIAPKKKAVRRVSAKQRKKIAARKVIRLRWWAEGRRKCGICGRQIFTVEESTLDHIVPGSGKDDTERNLQMAHILCNNEKGSRRNYTPKATSTLTGTQSRSKANGTGDTITD
jgi:5-methylcytosine-specific restriction endonuclease McrA